MIALLLAVVLAQPARPPAFNPAQDAPHTVGQPGHVEPMRLPPEPRPTRVLPETPETRRGPGLWAAEGAPRARGDDGNPQEPDGMPNILGVEVPIATPYGPIDIGIAAQCASEVSDAIQQSNQQQTASLWTPEKRRCAVALWYAQCIRLKVRIFENASKSDLIMAGKRASESASAFQAKECSPDTLTLDDKTVWNIVNTRWLARGHR